jgi:hypothetical protein
MSVHSRPDGRKSGAALLALIGSSALGAESTNTQFADIVKATVSGHIHLTIGMMQRLRRVARSDQPIACRTDARRKEVHIV